MLSQGAIVPILLIAAITICWLERVQAWKRLLLACSGFLFVWWLTALTLFETGADGRMRQVEQAPPALAAALCLALAAVALLLWRPSLSASRQLRRRARVVAAAATAIGGIGSGAASLLLAGLIARAI